MSFNEYINSPDFKRQTGYVAQDTSKFLGKSAGIIIKQIALFIKEIFRSILGK